jgi:hypothetical protein
MASGADIPAVLSVPQPGSRTRPEQAIGSQDEWPCPRCGRPAMLHLAPAGCHRQPERSGRRCGLACHQVHRHQDGHRPARTAEASGGAHDRPLLAGEERRAERWGETLAKAVLTARHTV